MLWMITDFLKSGNLDDAGKVIERALKNGADKVSLRNSGKFSQPEVLNLALELSLKFPEKEVFFHNPDNQTAEKYNKFHFSERFFSKALNLKERNKNNVVAVSVHSEKMIDRAFKAGLDYVFYSPVYHPISKPEDNRKTVEPKDMKNLYLLGGINRMRGRSLIEKGFTNLAGISLFYGDTAVKDISELSDLIKENCI